MSGRNDEANGMALVVACLIGGLIIMGAIIFAVLVILSAFQAALAYIALLRPFTFFGERLDRKWALTVLGSGIACALGLPAFAAFCAALYDLNIQDDVWGWLVLGSYVLGSLGSDAIMSLAKENAAPAAPVARPATKQIEAEPVTFVPPQPFTYASWDDEEEMR